jgi:hypothetical protein
LWGFNGYNINKWWYCVIDNCLLFFIKVSEGINFHIQNWCSKFALIIRLRGTRISIWSESSNYRSTRINILNIPLINFYSRALVITGAFTAGCVPWIARYFGTVQYRNPSTEFCCCTVHVVTNISLIPTYAHFYTHL